jgi:DNA-binding transcriptional MerR regulator
MKLSELAKASGAPVPTIKFYIREGLLPKGESVSSTRAHYTDSHLRRLEIISILKDELGMSVEKIGEVLRAAEQGGERLLAVGMASARQSRHGARKSPGLARNETRRVETSRAQKRTPSGASEHHARACGLLEKTARQLGWQLTPGDPIALDVTDALATILRVMPDSRIEDSLSDYARAMKSIADQEIPDSFDPRGSPWQSLRYAVLGTYLFEPLLLALRRLAHAERTTQVIKHAQKSAQNDAPENTRKSTRKGAQRVTESGH